MKTIDEWNKEAEANMLSLGEEIESAETVAEALPIVVRGLEFAARHFAAVYDHRSDGSGAAPEDAIRRASRALVDGALLLAIMEMRGQIETCPDPDPDCGDCAALGEAVDFLEHTAEGYVAGDIRARAGS